MSTARPMAKVSHALLENLEELFASDPDIAVVASCRTGEGALAVLRIHPDSVLVLDLRMPGTHGLEVLRAIRTANLPARVVVFTAALDDDEMMDSDDWANLVSAAMASTVCNQPGDGGKCNLAGP